MRPEDAVVIALIIGSAAAPIAYMVQGFVKFKREWIDRGALDPFTPEEIAAMASWETDEARVA